MLTFRQVDVFSTEPLRGNPVAVVHDADGVPDDVLADFARWTNLSETTFLLPPTDPGADYRVRIFTPRRELPFAGHPTLGSAHAWLEAGGVPQREGVVVQECGAGLVEVRRDAVGGLLAFAGPPLIRSGPVEEADLDRIVATLGITRADVVESAWIDNGPGWVGLLLADADAVLALRPTAEADRTGVAGLHPTGSEVALEVRAFMSNGDEDPVTGSLNAGLGGWLAGRVLPETYVAAQGTVIGRSGRVHVHRTPDGVVWVGGATTTRIVGEVDLPGAGRLP